MEDAELLLVKPDVRELIRSRIFPALVLDVNALLAMNAAKVLAVLRRFGFSGSQDVRRQLAINRPCSCTCQRAS